MGWSSVSTEVPCRTLGEYIAALIDGLGEMDPAALARLRQVVGERRARIALDEEVVDVTFVGQRLIVEPPEPGRPIDGEGWCDRGTVLGLLDGYVEVSEAVLDGRLAARGNDEAVAALFQAVEILLDAAPRAPGLQTLATAFRLDPCRPPVRPRLPAAPTETSGDEVLLAALDLLPD
jgi:hypothetical protein